MGKYEVISDKSKKIKRIIVLISSISIIVLGIVAGIYYFLSLEKESKIIDNNIKLAKKNKDTNSSEAVDSSKTDDNKGNSNNDISDNITTSPKKALVVDIKGQIKHPGTYEVDENTRVIDVIKIAGGLTSNADTSLINLSKKVFDEMVIIVHSKDEVVKINSDDSEKEKIKIENDAVIDKENNDEKESIKIRIININIATINELITLPGIGESKAQDIINYRISNGNFKTIDEIMNVSGIGESLFAKIKENITV